MNTQNKICLTHFDYDRLKLMISDHTKRNKVENNVKFLLVRSQSIDNSASHDQMGRALTRSASLPRQTKPFRTLTHFKSHSKQPYIDSRS